MGLISNLNYDIYRLRGDNNISNEFSILSHKLTFNEIRGIVIYLSEKYNVSVDAFYNSRLGCMWDIKVVILKELDLYDEYYGKK